MEHNINNIVNDIIGHFNNEYISEKDVNTWLIGMNCTAIEIFKIKNEIDKYDIKTFNKCMYNTIDPSDLAYHEIVEKYGDFYITENDVTAYLDLHYNEYGGNFRDIIKHKVEYYNNVYFFDYTVNANGMVEEKIQKIESNETIVNDIVKELIEIANDSYIFDADINEYFKTCFYITPNNNIISRVKERITEYNSAHTNEKNPYHYNHIDPNKIAEEIIDIFGNTCISEKAVECHINNIYGALSNKIIFAVKQQIECYNKEHFDYYENINDELVNKIYNKIIENNDGYIYISDINNANVCRYNNLIFVSDNTINKIIEKIRDYNNMINNDIKPTTNDNVITTSNLDSTNKFLKEFIDKITETENINNYYINVLNNYSKTNKQNKKFDKNKILLNF